MTFAFRTVYPQLTPEQRGDAQNFYADRIAGRGPADVGELAAARARLSGPVAEVSAHADMIDDGSRLVPVRIFTPSGRARGVYLDIHGGGFYMDSAARGDARNRALSDALGIVVASVDYRLAPENPWPAAPDDCEAAASWLARHAPARFGTSRMAIGGSSAGATLALVTALRLKNKALPVELVGTVLQFGTFDLSARTPAGRLIADEYFLEAYVGHVADRTLPDISPIFADVRGLPPALLVVGSGDVLLEDNLAMSARLTAAGNDGELRIYPDVPHGFTGHRTAVAQAALDDILTWLSERFPQA